MLSFAALFEEFEDAPRNGGDYCNKKAGILQRQQPCSDGGNSHRSEHDVESATKFVHRFDHMQVVVAEARLDFEQHGGADDELVAEVDTEGEWLCEVVSPESGGEGEHGDQAKKNEGGGEGAWLDVLNQIEELMLQHPEARSDDEGDDEGDPVAKGLCECVGELAVRHPGRHLDIQDEQGHHDGEDRIAEGFEPVLAIHGVTIVLDCESECKWRVL